MNELVEVNENEAGEKVSEQTEQSVLDEKEQQIEYLKIEYLKPFVDRMFGLAAESEVKKHIQELSLEKAINNVNKVMSYLNSETVSMSVAVDNCDVAGDLLENVFYLFSVTMLEYKKQEKIAEEERKIRHELEDLENAKQIFGILKNEILKYTDNFDEFAISIYVNQMLEYARKHKLDLGMEETKTYS